MCDVSTHMFDDVSQIKDAHIREAIVMLDACDYNENGVKVIEGVGNYCSGRYNISEGFLKKLAARDKVKL